MRARRNLFNVEALLETVNTSARVNQLLLAGVERMALGTDIHLHLFLGRAGFKVSPHTQRTTHLPYWG